MPKTIPEIEKAIRKCRQSLSNDNITELEESALFIQIGRLKLKLRNLVKPNSHK